MAFLAPNRAAVGIAENLNVLPEMNLIALL